MSRSPIAGPDCESVYRIESAPGPDPQPTDWRLSCFVDDEAEAWRKFRQKVSELGARFSFRLLRGQTWLVRISPGYEVQL